MGWEGRSKAFSDLRSSEERMKLFMGLWERESVVSPRCALVLGCTDGVRKSSYSSVESMLYVIRSDPSTTFSEGPISRPGSAGYAWKTQRVIDIRTVKVFEYYIYCFCIPDSWCAQASQEFSAIQRADCQLLHQVLPLHERRRARETHRLPKSIMFLWKVLARKSPRSGRAFCTAQVRKLRWQGE